MGEKEYLRANSCDDRLICSCGAGLLACPSKSSLRSPAGREACPTDLAQNLPSKHYVRMADVGRGVRPEIRRRPASPVCQFTLLSLEWRETESPEEKMDFSSRD